MDLGLIALIIVGAGKTLDYIAPRTKTKVDDRIRGAFQWAIGFLPFVKKDLADAVGRAQKEPPETMARTSPQVRDHRR